jgi:hypothetical protein
MNRITILPLKHDAVWDTTDDDIEYTVDAVTTGLHTSTQAFYRVTLQSDGGFDVTPSEGSYADMVMSSDVDSYSLLDGTVPTGSSDNVTDIVVTCEAADTGEQRWKTSVFSATDNPVVNTLVL